MNLSRTGNPSFPFCCPSVQEATYHLPARSTASEGAALPAQGHPAQPCKAGEGLPSTPPRSGFIQRYSGPPPPTLRRGPSRRSAPARTRASGRTPARPVARAKNRRESLTTAFWLAAPEAPPAYGHAGRGGGAEVDGSLGGAGLSRPRWYRPRGAAGRGGGAARLAGGCGQAGGGGRQQTCGSSAGRCEERTPGGNAGPGRWHSGGRPARGCAGPPARAVCFPDAYVHLRKA